MNQNTGIGNTDPNTYFGEAYGIDWEHIPGSEDVRVTQRGLANLEQKFLKQHFNEEDLKGKLIVDAEDYEFLKTQERDVTNDNAELDKKLTHIEERIQWILGGACEIDRDARNELEALGR